jgi:hypothetical protein
MKDFYTPATSLPIQPLDGIFYRVDSTRRKQKPLYDFNPFRRILLDSLDSKNFYPRPSPALFAPPLL